MTTKTMRAIQAIAAFNYQRGYSPTHDVLLVAKLRAAGLSEEHVAAALAAVESTCKHCWNAEAATCCCMRDE